MPVGEYGATTGLTRVFAHAGPAADSRFLFIPAVSAILHPDMIKEIQKGNRHEIGVHGWIHEFSPLVGSAEKEEELLNRAIDYLTKATGKRPVGYREPSWAFSPYTLGELMKAGFLYDSSMMAMDQPYELVSKGKATGRTELPVTWI
jgi:peptidoglycan/xylan/chitin deacetylase (PgdA/CDA1 family)